MRRLDIDHAVADLLDDELQAHAAVGRGLPAADAAVHGHVVEVIVLLELEPERLLRVD